MRTLNRTSEFKRCVKLLARRHWDLNPLKAVIVKLANDVPAEQLFKDHPLVGSFVGKRECHVTSISDNWVLVYHKSGDSLFLHSTGTHADVFGE